MRLRQTAPAWMGAAALLVALTGCASTPAAADARLVARSFADAVRQQDGAAACALLSERARESVESSGGTCADELPRRELRVGSPGAATVWGDAAQVHAPPETLFLGEYADGWRVTGAGCRPRGEELPYQCAVGGS